MSVSRTAFTRIHRDALPTSEKKNERKARNARIAFAPRYGSRPVPAMHFSSHIGRRPVVGERARLVARSLQRVQREEDRQGGHTERGEKGREGGPPPAWLLALLIPFFLPYAFPPFRLAHLPRICLHSLPSQLYMRGETHYMSFQKS